MINAFKVVLALAIASLSGNVHAGSRAAPANPGQADSALVVIDAQVGALGSAWDSKRIIRNIEILVSRARARGVPVIWVQHSNNKDMKAGSDSWKIVKDLTPAPSELKIHKRFNSSFAETNLDQKLKDMGVKHLVIAGAQTNWCVRSTAYAAIERGYNLTLVGDAHSTENLALEGGKTVEAESMISDLNATFQWILAPGVHSEVRSTSEVTF